MSSEEELDYDEEDIEEEIADTLVEQKRRKTVKKGGGKKVKDPNKPKRNMTAFFLFSNANRARIKAEYPTASFGELVSSGAVLAQLREGLVDTRIAIIHARDI